MEGRLAAVPGVTLARAVVPDTLAPRDPAARAVVGVAVRAAVVVEPAVFVIGVRAVGAGDRVVPSTAGLVGRVTVVFPGTLEVRMVLPAAGPSAVGVCGFTGVRAVVAVAGLVVKGLVEGFLAAEDAVVAAPGAIPRDARVDVLLGFSDIVW